MKNINCWFRVPNSTLFEMARNFKKKLKGIGDELEICKHFSITYYMQANRQVEEVTKMLRKILKRKLNIAKGLWPNEFP